MKRYFRTLILSMLLLASLTACDSPPSPTAGQTPPGPTETSVEPGTASVESEPTPLDTPIPPTPEPLALAINGEMISLADFKEALARFQMAREEPLPVEQAADAVLQDLLDNTLLAQSAADAGFIVDDALLDQRLADLTTHLGGTELLAAWQANNGYTPDTFRSELRLSIASAWMRDQIIQGIPEQMPQVRARQILLYNQEEAQSVLDGLRSGTSFETMLSIYDPFSLGELGWFPQGYLAYPAIEQAALALQPGQTSDIIQTELGYHIIQVVDVQPERPLDPAVRLVFQEKALREWLAAQRETSEIVIYLSDTKEELR